MEQFDFVVVGGGSAGSIVASRLSESGASVCLLESGPMDRNFWIHVPGGAQKVHNNPALTWCYEARGPEGTGRLIPAKHGRVLGGSGSINGMMINRGAARDYDRWAQLGNGGWSYAELLPYFMRTERRIGEGDDRVRGRSGPLPVTDNDWRTPLRDAFIESARRLGLAAQGDLNGPEPDGVYVMQFNMFGRRRVSSARAFLHPAMHRHASLSVRTNAHAVRVVFEGRRAIGVRYVLGENRRTELEVHARREVILCAGAVGTPKLLHVSGVGPASVLQDIGVPVVHPLEGVGNNLQDHYHVRTIARIRNAPTINALASGPRLVGEVLKWLSGRPSIVGNSPYTALAACRSGEGIEAPDVTVIFTPGSFKAETRSMNPAPGASCIVWQMRPASRGRTRAASRDPFALPVIEPNYLSAEEDCRVLIGGIRMARRIFSGEPFAQHFAGEEAPGAALASEAQLLEFARSTGTTCFHFTSSCRMGPAGDPSSVVDEQLRMRGMDRLRVADASIMPAMVSGNTNAPTMMIAEKAADMILGRPPLPAGTLHGNEASPRPSQVTRTSAASTAH